MKSQSKQETKTRDVKLIVLVYVILVFLFQCHVFDHQYQLLNAH